MHPQHVRVIALLSLDHGCIFLADVGNQQMIPMTHISMTFTIWKQVMDCPFFNLGPFYTIAKGLDHEVVRALETHPKALSWKVQIKFCVVTGLKYSVTAYATGPLNK
jgi:hypothetical protein